MLKTGSLITLVTIFSMILIVPNSHAQDPSQNILVDVGSTALWVEISGDRVYVSNPADGTIVVVDKNTNQIINTIPAIEGVAVLEIVEEKNKIYATATQQPQVFVYDLETGESLGEIDIGEAEITLYSKSDKPYGQREYITFKTNAIGLDYNPSTELLYAVHSTVNHVNIIDTNTDTNLGDIAVGRTPLLITIDERRDIGYVTNRESNSVSVIDLEAQSEIKTLNTGFVPDQMEIDHDNNRLYVTHHASPHVSVIDLRTQEIETEIVLKGPTHALKLDKNRSRLHVTYLPESGLTGPGFTDEVEFIDTQINEVVGNLKIDDNPFTIAVDDQGDTLYATIIEDGTLVIVNLSEVDDYLSLTGGTSETTEPESAAGPEGGCLIATAVYGTELAPQVQLLREIRDNTLLSTTSGTTFMAGFNSLYYSFSPAVADLERENPAFREATKFLIAPMLLTLSIMTLADEDSEPSVLGLGISVIALNLGMYIVVPTVVGFKIRKYLESRK